MDKWGQIYKELTSLREKAHLIHARYTVEIFAQPMSDIDYNSRSRLRDAKVTLLLAEDKEYQEILQKIWQLEAELEELKAKAYELETKALLDEVDELQL